jgi:uncharacterized protein (DUF2267 family)
MQHDEFIGQVVARAHLDSRGAAERATRAVLETLSERLPQDEAHHLASQLPREIGEHIERAKGTAGNFGVDGFIDRVAEREGVKKADAAFHTRCVIEVLEEAVTEGQMDHVLQALPEEYVSLFEAGSQGELR